MNRAIRSLILCAIFVLCCFTPTLAAGTLVEQDAPVAEDISVRAYSAILLDMDSDMVLYEYNADEMNYPASTTKIMTAYLCLKYGDPEDTVTVSSSAFSDISAAASTGGLVVGETMTVHRLLQSLLVISASEAANVVAEYVSGSREEFVELMNEEAEALGCTGTHFANCHGLPNSDHYTTARDLAAIAMAAMEYKEFRDIVGSAVTTMEATNRHGARTIVSTNGLLPGSRYPDYNYPYAIGIKTGHTSVAGYCLVSAADKDGRRLLSVVMGTPSRVSSFAQTIDLFDWGYENYDIIAYNEALTAPPPEPPADEPDSQLEPDSVLELEEEPAPSLAPTPTPPPTPEPAAVSEALAPPEESQTTAPVFSLTTMLIFLGVAIFLALALLVTLIVLLVRRRR